MKRALVPAGILVLVLILIRCSSVTSTSAGLSLSGPSAFVTYTCQKFTVSALDRNGNAASVPATTVTLTGLGTALAFATLSDCQTSDSLAVTSATLSGSSVDFFLRAKDASALTITAATASYGSASAAATPTLFQVLGSPNLTTIPGYPTGLDSPSTVSVQHGKLFIADALFNRVLVWNTPPTAAGVPPDLVIGQKDLYGTVANGGLSSTNNFGLSYPQGVVYDGTHLFVTDNSNNRVLVWKTFPTSNGAAADFALGQPAGTTNLTSGSSGATAAAMNGPNGLFYDGTNLFVAESSNNRVLVWASLSPDTITTTNVPAASFALGQPQGSGNLTGSGAGCDGASMSSPYGVFAVGTQLFVTDSGNNRTLVWNNFSAASVTIANVPAADYALGQPSGASNLTTCSAGAPVSGGTMKGVSQIMSDGTGLYIADSGNARVLVFSAIPSTSTTTASVPAASYAVGQPDLATSTSPSSATSTNTAYPIGVWSDGTRLFVSDQDFTRVLVWDAIPANGTTAASFALGQAPGALNFTNTGFGAGIVSGQTFSGIAGMATDGTRLFAADSSNNRVLVWNTFPTTNGQSADFALGQPSGANNLLSGAVSSSLDGATMGPTGVSSDGHRLFVADENNHRVLVWNTIPTAPVAADFALGVPAGSANLTTKGANSATASTFSYPWDVSSDGQRLFVADSGNQRILVWNQIPSQPTPADFALGQPAGSSNLTSHGAGLAADGINGLGGVFSDGTHLIYADPFNDRVLIWSPIPTSAVPANIVLGQSDFVSGNAGSGNIGLNYPENVRSDGKRLFVVDTGNNRVLVWDPFPTTSGQPATAVIGQSDFSGTNANYTGAVSGSGLNFPGALFTDATRLFILDQGNDRALIVPTGSY